MKPQKPNTGLTSVEAAALYLSDGATKDPILASQYHSANADIYGNMLRMDAQQRAQLQAMMGFNFQFKVRPTKLSVASKQQPYVTTYCLVKEGEMDEFGNVFSEALIDRLVDACLRLKEKYELAQAKEKK